MPGKFTSAAAVLVLVTGCTGLSQKIDAKVDETDSRASTLAGETGRSMPGGVKVTTPSVVHESGIWIGRSVVRLGAKPLPPIFYEPATFDRTVESLSELAERITLRSGIPVKVAPDVLGMDDTAAAGQVEGGAAPMPAPRPVSSPRRPSLRLSQLPGSPGLAAGAPGTGVNRPMTPIRITYNNGNFKGLLDTVVARFGVSWKYEDGVISIFHTDVRTFQISAIPGDSAFTAHVVSGATSTGGVGSAGAGGGGGGGGGGGTGGGGATSGGVNTNNSQNTTVASKLSVYSSIENTIKTMLSSHGRVAASPATGAITVVDTPESLDRIAAYIDNENKVLTRQVVVNVTILSVSLAENDEYGINWNLVYSTLRNKYGIVNRLASPTGGTGFTAGVVGDSRFAGSSVMINALSQQGKVRRHTTASIVTLNNQPVPVQVARQTTYLQSSQISFVPQVGVTSSMTPGTVTAGFNMSILPHVLSNGTVMLQFSIDLSTLRQIRPVESNGAKIETPELDTRNFLQRVAMKSNETLIISGFEQSDENLDNQGVGQPRNYLLGGGYKASSNKEVIVILITPSTVTGS